MKPCPVCNTKVEDLYTGLCPNQDCTWEFEFVSEMSPEVQRRYEEKLRRAKAAYAGMRSGEKPPPKKEIDKNSNKPPVEWVSIPAGTFTMGSQAGEVGRFDDETQHQVTLSAFSMSKCEITFDQYDAFCSATYRRKLDDAGWGRGRRPVINVSWKDVTAFARWMGCRLPTEAEWEYACRAGTTTPFNTGSNLTTDQANYDGNYSYNGNAKGQYREKTTPVGSFPPNYWGLYDMHGNVWEWCSDRYGDYLTLAQTNPQGPSSGSDHVIRGGSWDSYAQYCRNASRGSHPPGHRRNYLGFRLVSPG